MAPIRSIGKTDGLAAPAPAGGVTRDSHEGVHGGEEASRAAIPKRSDAPRHPTKYKLRMTGPGRSVPSGNASVTFRNDDPSAGLPPTMACTRKPGERGVALLAFRSLGSWPWAGDLKQPQLRILHVWWERPLRGLRAGRPDICGAGPHHRSRRKRPPNPALARPDFASHVGRGSPDRGRGGAGGLTLRRPASPPVGRRRKRLICPMGGCPLPGVRRAAPTFHEA